MNLGNQTLSQTTMSRQMKRKGDESDDLKTPEIPETRLRIFILIQWNG